MYAPSKPWENAMNSNVSLSTGNKPYVSNTDRLYSSAIPFPGSGGGSVSVGMNPTAMLPPVPPRPAQIRPIYSAYNRSSMMPYSSPYSNVSSYGMGNSYYNNPYGQYASAIPASYGMGGMGAYGNRMYGSQYTPSPFGMPQGEPSFSQMAEESAASAFSSIESFVSAFGSISAMFDSTFHALYSSFRAVIGVADHLGRVKQILSALAVFRFFKWVYRRLLYLVGISKIKPADIESLWNNLSTTEGVGESMGFSELRQGSSKPSSWPIVMFLGFIFAGPYLMWKLIKSLNLDPSKKVENRQWASGESEHFVATAEFSFDTVQDSELALKQGQTIRLAPAIFQPPDVKGWVLASDGVKIGLVPTNYIKIRGKRSKDIGDLNNITQQSASYAQLPRGMTSAQGSCNNDIPSIINVDSHLDINNQNDLLNMSSDDDSETLVGEPLGD